MREPLPLDLTEAEIRHLGEGGRYQEAEATYRERVSKLSPAGAVAAATALIEVREQSGSLAEAGALLEELRDELAPALGGPLPAEVEIAFHNTAGNVLRAVGRYAEGLHEYAVAERRLAETVDPRRWSQTLYMNWVQGLQKLEAHSSAISLLTRWAATEPPTGVLADILASVSDSLYELGQFEEALAMAEDAVGLVPGDLPVEPPMARQHALMALIRVCGEIGDERLVQSARRLVDDELGSGDPSRAAWALATAARVLRRHERAGWRELAEEAQANVAAGRAAVSHHELRGDELIQAESRLLEVLDDVEGLERLLSEAVTPSLPVLTALIALRAQRGELERAGPELRTAWKIELRRILGSGALGIGDVDRLRAIDELRAWTAQRAFAAFDAGSAADNVLLAAAELQSTLMGGFLAWPRSADGEGEGDPLVVLEPRALLADVQDAAVVFAVRAGADVRIVLIDGGSEEVLLRWDASELERTRLEVEAVTRRASPRGDPLSRSARWTELSHSLGTALASRLETDRHVVFVMGSSLGGLPLHAVAGSDGPLCRRHGCSYIASLLQLAGIRARHAQQPRSFERGGVAAVWRTRDLPATRAAFEEGGDAFAKLLRRHNIEVETLSGLEATEEAVTALLASVDLMYVSCHGVGASDGRHAYLVAGEGQLPPMLFRSKPLPGGPDFMLQWDELPDRTPPVVVSAACSSSSGSMSVGGERVSLDRALLTSGTRTFTGPLWDVTVESSTAFSVDLVRRVLTTGGSWGASWRDAVNELAEVASPASWQAFILVGDWR